MYTLASSKQTSNFFSNSQNLDGLLTIWVVAAECAHLQFFHVHEWLVITEVYAPTQSVLLYSTFLAGTLKPAKGNMLTTAGGGGCKTYQVEHSTHQGQL